MALLRSAEVAREHGFHYFAVVDERESVSRSAVMIPGATTTTTVAPGRITSSTFASPAFVAPVRKPQTSNVIMCFEERPPIDATPIFDADFIVKNLGAKYPR